MSLLRRYRSALVVAAIILVPIAWLGARDPGGDDAAIVTAVSRGDFRVTVSTSGELSARESVDILAPTNARQAGIYQLTIQSLVPEGTVVAEGEVVATLDRSEIDARRAEVELALQKAAAVYEQAMLDSALQLAEAREEIRGLELELEERRLEEEQAVYEPPAIRRKAQIALERADRQLTQARDAYETKMEQARAKMREVGADMERERNRLTIVQQVMEQFTVRAPAPGMVIYVKEWDGRKKTAGTQVSPWDPTVATLPDLTKMESVTYVNEIDIRKIAEGQPVVITLDADPTKCLNGTVSAVANVGEQRPNNDAKVFEVHVMIETADTTLRPGMTTGNAIETALMTDVLHVPIEAVFSEDGVAFVYRREGTRVRKQQVVTGAMNENEVVLVEGVEEGDVVLMAPPADANRLDIERLPDGSEAGPGTAGEQGDEADTGTRRADNDRP